MSDWSAWSECSAGKQDRGRVILFRAEAPCPELEESQSCTGTSHYHLIFSLTLTGKVGNAGLVVGIIIGVVVLLILILIAVIFIVKRIRRKKARSSKHTKSTPSASTSSVPMQPVPYAVPEPLPPVPNVNPPPPPIPVRPTAVSRSSFLYSII